MKAYAPLKDFEPVITMLSQISFLGGFSDDQLDVILGSFETAHFEKGEMIARRGEEPTHIYIIRSGRVNLLLQDEAMSLAKRSFGPGDSFGEAAMLSLNNNTASFVAAEPCELVAFSRKALNRLHVTQPRIFCHLLLNLARELARKLQYTDEMLLHHELENPPE